VLIDVLFQIHQLQKIKRYEIICWNDQKVNERDLNNSVFLLVNYQKRGLEVPIIKHFEEGYRVIVCQAGFVENLDFFEFAMTVLRVWPRVIEVSEKESDIFLYTFKYGGKNCRKRELDKQWHWKRPYAQLQTRLQFTFNRAEYEI